MTDPQYLTPGEAASLLRFASATTFLRWARRVRLPMVRLSQREIRIARITIERELKKQTIAH